MHILVYNLIILVNIAYIKQHLQNKDTHARNETEKCDG